jgi:pimeloyl-ACP methyl ester carboxylesterase
VNELRIRLGDASVGYTDTGGGADPIIFLHGNSSSRTAFAAVIAQLQPQSRCVAFDLFGHGSSSLPSDGCSLPRYVQMLPQVLSALSISACTLVGHSLGGHIAMEALPLLREHVRIRALIGISAPPFKLASLRDALRDPVDGLLFQPDLSLAEVERVALALANPRNVSPGEHRLISDRIIATSPDARRAIARSIASGELGDEVEICRASPVPRLFIQGSEDGFVAQDYLEKLSAHAPLRLALLEGVRHSPHLEAPLAVARAIRAMLA